MLRLQLTTQTKGSMTEQTTKRQENSLHQTFRIISIIRTPAVAKLVPLIDVVTCCTVVTLHRSYSHVYHTVRGSDAATIVGQYSLEKQANVEMSDSH